MAVTTIIKSNLICSYVHRQWAYVFSSLSGQGDDIYVARSPQISPRSMAFPVISW